MKSADAWFLAGAVCLVFGGLFAFGWFVLTLVRDAMAALRGEHLEPEPLAYSAADIKAIEADEEWARQEREARRWRREQERERRDRGI